MWPIQKDITVCLVTSVINAVIQYDQTTAQNVIFMQHDDK